MEKSKNFPLISKQHQKPTSMRSSKIFSSVNLKAGIIVLAVSSILLASCGSSHDVCPAYKGYNKHGKR